MLFFIVILSRCNVHKRMNIIISRRFRLFKSHKKKCSRIVSIHLKLRDKRQKNCTTIFFVLKLSSSEMVDSFIGHPFVSCILNCDFFLFLSRNIMSVLSNASNPFAVWIKNVVEQKETEEKYRTLKNKFGIKHTMGTCCIRHAVCMCNETINSCL